ncbi:hypothetical protein KXX32_008102 [Aspergillus fumigatus]|uniref:Uncharacterized protein n=1 Tax=Aspergillus fumigatus TaxID=746128 RepID=A0A9P8N9A9_ASPFM|nr:hypothetical protein KXX32_008102 [Aspergillus fumigatus]KAH1894142.1 hypothetical protein KXV57_002535 [Aspergillus fumigatus]
MSYNRVLPRPVPLYDASQARFPSWSNDLLKYKIVNDEGPTRLSLVNWSIDDDLCGYPDRGPATEPPQVHFASKGPSGSIGRIDSDPPVASPRLKQRQGSYSRSPASAERVQKFLGQRTLSFYIGNVTKPQWWLRIQASGAQIFLGLLGRNGGRSVKRQRMDGTPLPMKKKLGISSVTQSTGTSPVGTAVVAILLQ